MQAIIYEYEQDLEELLGYLISRAGFDCQFTATLEEFKGNTSDLRLRPDLILLGTCPPSYNQLDHALAMRSEFPDGHFLVLTTNRKDCEAIAGQGDPGFSCLEVPFPPKMLTQKLQQIKGSLGTVKNQ